MLIFQGILKSGVRGDHVCEKNAFLMYSYIIKEMASVSSPLNLYPVQRK